MSREPRETPAAPEGARCKGVTRSGEPCKRPARPGELLCRYHATKPPRLQARPRKPGDRDAPE